MEACLDFGLICHIWGEGEYTLSGRYTPRWGGVVGQGHQLDWALYIRGDCGWLNDKLALQSLLQCFQPLWTVCTSHNMLPPSSFPSSSLSPHSDIFIQCLAKFVLPFVQNHFLVYKVGPNVVMNVWQNSWFPSLCLLWCHRYCNQIEGQLMVHCVISYSYNWWHHS